MNPGRAGEQSPETISKSETLEEKVERTADIRDEVTKTLLSNLITENKSVRKFVTDACKFGKIRPPKPHDNLAPFVYKLQKHICKFPEIESKNGCDGKLGPITFNKLLEEIPRLKVFSKKERTEKFKAQRQSLAASTGLPNPPGLSGEQAEINPQMPKTKATNAVTIGDSLTYGLGKYFYKGTKKFGRYNREYFKIGRSVVSSRRRLEGQLDALKNKPAVSVWLGTNDLAYRSADRIFTELERIYTMLIDNNPEVRIVAVTLLPHPKYQHKIDVINRRIKEFARNHQKNLSVLDAHDQVADAQKQGMDVFYNDNIHIKEKYSRGIAGMLKDHLENNTNGRLTDYV